MTALLRFLAILILAAPAAQAAIPADAQALLDKHVAWLGGWSALDAQRDLALEGTIQVSGLTGTIAVRERHDGRVRMEYDLKLVKGVECLDGAAGWERNASGQVEDIGTDKAAQMQRQHDRTFDRHLRGEGVEVSAAGTVEKGGRTWSVLRFAYPDGDLYDLLVDPATGESVWSRTVEDGRETWTLVSDLRVVDGVRFAFKQETFAEHAAENQVVTWTRVGRQHRPGRRRLRAPGREHARRAAARRRDRERVAADRAAHGALDLPARQRERRRHRHPARLGRRHDGARPRLRGSGRPARRRRHRGARHRRRDGGRHGRGRHAADSATSPSAR